MKEETIDIIVSFPCGYKITLNKIPEVHLDVEKIVKDFKECPLHGKNCYQVRLLADLTQKQNKDEFDEDFFDALNKGIEAFSKRLKGDKKNA